MQPRRIRSKDVRRQVGHGQIGILSWFPRFDYEHEHRFTEHFWVVDGRSPSSIARGLVVSSTNRVGAGDSSSQVLM